MQGISPLTIELSHVNISSGNYPFNITYGEVLHIGSHITNTSVALGDSLLSSLDISITGISVRLWVLIGSPYIVKSHPHMQAMFCNIIVALLLW